MNDDLYIIRAGDFVKISNGDAKGCALVFGPLWLGIARLSRENTNDRA